MKPLWRLQSGRFVGWRTDDGQLYDADGDHIGYFVDDVAYSSDGRAVGEVYGDRWLGKHETVVYPTGTQQSARESRGAAGLADRQGMALAGWTDPEL